jgi:GAF domain-containing protein/anti-sigma regulatory factor (Ser/Thr protein kinase)
MVASCVLMVASLPAGEEPGAVEITLPPELASVGHARRALDLAADRWHVPPELLADARLALSELVTNGVLHARTELHVRIERPSVGLRLEVRDSSAGTVVPPVQMATASSGILDDPGEMQALVNLFTSPSFTGRGMALVAALADGWGVRPTEDGGKVVWAELGTGASGAVLESPSPRLYDEAVYPVRLIAVPVRLVVESDRHLDDVLRELGLAALDERSTVSPVLVGLADDLLGRLNSMREGARWTARRALEAGDRLVDMNLLARSDTMASFDQLEALFAAAAREARSGQLLALPPSREVVAWRRWLRAEVEAQLRGEPPRACPFPVVPPTAPAGSDQAWAAVDDARERSLVGLQEAVEAVEGDEAVERVVLERAVADLGASRAMLYLLGVDNETVTCKAAVGFDPEVTSYWASFPLSADLPASECIRTGRTVVTRTLAEREVRYPALTGHPEEQDPAVVCVPLRVGRHTSVGTLVVAFPQARDFSPTEVGFLESLAALVAQAIVSQRRIEADRQGEAMELVLAGATARLAGAADEDEVAEILARAAVPAVAEVAAVFVGAGPAQLRLAALHADQRPVGPLVDFFRRWPPGPSSLTWQVMQSTRSVRLQTLTDEALVDSALDEAHLAALRALQVRTVAVVALVGEHGRAMGGLAMANAPGRFITNEQLALAERLAADAGRTLERLRAHSPLDESA